MLTIAIPADWNPDDAGPWRDFALNSMIVLTGPPAPPDDLPGLLGPLGLISWYETGAESEGSDARFNLRLPMGLKRCSTGPPSPTA